RGILRALGYAVDEADILNREKSLRNVNHHHDGQSQGGKKYAQRDRLVTQHHIERALIERQHRSESAFDEAVYRPMIVRFGPHESRAQHGRQRQRDQRRHRDRGGDRQGEFAEQAPDDAAHQQQRNEDRDEGQADREDGEADLARALERGIHRRLAVLDMAMDIFHHDDRVIDHEPDRDGQRHQREIVEAEIEQVHGCERAEQRQRHRHGGNERRPEIAQEQQYHQHYQHDRQHQREFHVLHGGADGGGAAELHTDVDRRRNPRRQAGQQLLHLVDDLDDVGARLLEDSQENAALAVLVAGDGAVGFGVDRLADIADPDRAAIAVGEHDVVERLGVDDLIVGRDREAGSRRIDGPLRRDRGGGDQGAAHFLERQAARRELTRIEGF